MEDSKTLIQKILSTDPMDGIRLEGKLFRALRWERFLEKVLPIIQKKSKATVVNEEQGSITFFHQAFGKLIVYPKANRILIAPENKWISGAYNWMRKNIDST